MTLVSDHGIHRHLTFLKNILHMVLCFFDVILILPQSTPQMQAASHTRRKVLTLVCNLSADTSLQTYCYVNMSKLIGSVSCTLTAARGHQPSQHILLCPSHCICLHSLDRVMSTMCAALPPAQVILEAR